MEQDGECSNSLGVKREASGEGFYLTTSYPLPVQCPIFGPAAFSPWDTSLKRTVDPHRGHFPRMVSVSSCSYWFSFSHMSSLHMGQVRTCVAMLFLVHSA